MKHLLTGRSLAYCKSKSIRKRLLIVWNLSWDGEHFFSWEEALIHNEIISFCHRKATIRLGGFIYFDDFVRKIQYEGLWPVFRIRIILMLIRILLLLWMQIRIRIQFLKWMLIRIQVASKKTSFFKRQIKSPESFIENKVTFTHFIPIALFF
jgi:hypothetical protein